MKPVKFKHQNIVFAENQPGYQALPALKIQSDTGEVISCWKLSFKERIKVLFLGRIWLSLMSFNKPLTPSFLAVDRHDVFSVPEDSLRTRTKIVEALKKLLQ